MGFATDLLAGESALLADKKGREWYDLIMQGKGGQAALDMIGLFSQGKFPKALLYAPGTRPYRDAWQETIDAAESYNEPGRFTALIGFEWTSLAKTYKAVYGSYPINSLRKPTGLLIEISERTP